MTIEYKTADSALELIKSGDRVFVHGSAATPRFLVNKLLAKAGTLKNIELTCISTYGEIDWNRPEVIDNGFFINSLFVSSNVREWVNGPNGNYVPVFLSEIPNLFEEGFLKLNVAIVQVSPPDRHGYCTLGTSVDAALCAVRMAPVVIAQVNPQMPRVMGDGVIHYSEFTAMVWQDSSLPEVDYSLDTDETAVRIGKHVASLIEDGATLQMGIGTIPDAVLKQLSGHKGLGVHTEMFSDGLVPLVEQGVITNEYKKVQPGRIVTSFILGTRKVYDFVNDNPFVNCMDVAFVNDSDVIRRNPKVVAINSAIEIDLTGQICADSIGTYQYSGIGGQMDFMRGASLSVGGKPIIAMPSVTRNGVSRIVSFLKPGAGVVTTRGHVHFIATEFGIVNLYGRNMEQRARLLISIAHPDHREQLEQAYYERFQKLYTAVK
ncbi:4-hydroxybutyrate CoA-transferase [Niabella sp. CC-SYL272]|uniref:acetyl-CoA hydrolase/transferase family protein n=1 Tax=Niabella agricola TaxID=2891571 RepID=UPI001F3025AC|nr:acetyl-CoA hydrolase/transferase C-terminal domain-containing protein [Niabella agricola]MCF3107656.1 4-hydroxybutyrate CoA-transferase [Niabella agricola]